MYNLPTAFANAYGDVNPNSWTKENGSENPTTFNVMLYFLLEEARELDTMDLTNIQHLLQLKYMTNGYKLKTNNYDNHDSFSLDESVSYAAACYRYGFKSDMKYLKIVTKQTWYRFYDVIPYLLICKYPFLKYLLLPYISLVILLSISILSKGDTSGKQLALIRMTGHDMKITDYFAGLILAAKGTSFKEALSIYYPEEKHPINILSREVWSE